MMLSSSLFDHCRGLVIAASAGLGFDRSINVLAQMTPALNDAMLMQLAEKGGGWVVLLVVLFFYRRDYQRLTTSENEVRKELLSAISRQSESEQKLAVALAANTELVRSSLAHMHGEHYEGQS